MPDGLLLLHAFPLDATMWEPQVKAVGGEVTVVTPNFPGFGGTPGVGPITRMDVAADVAADAVREAGLDRVVVCGLSMGGYAALAFWQRHREQVSGLVLANTRAGDDDAAAKMRREALARRVMAEGTGFLVESPPPLLSEGAPSALLDRVREIIRLQPPEAIAGASLGMQERPDFTVYLGDIDVPTLVVTSSGDRLIPPEATAPMAEQIPGAQLAVIEGAGHLSNLEAPEEFNRLLRGHLARCGVLPSKS